MKTVLQPWLVTSEPNGSNGSNGSYEPAEQEEPLAAARADAPTRT